MVRFIEVNSAPVKQVRSQRKQPRNTVSKIYHYIFSIYIERGKRCQAMHDTNILMKLSSNQVYFAALPIFKKQIFNNS